MLLHADDTRLVGDGIDATRLMFQAADRYGAPRAFVDGAVTLKISGPGLLVGDNPFELGTNGGAGAVWVKTRQGKRGRLQVAGSHPRLGLKSVEIEVVQDSMQTMDEQFGYFCPTLQNGKISGSLSDAAVVR